MAYTKIIKQNSQNSHQTSPSYVLSFIRWSYRDILNFGDKIENSFKKETFQTRNLLVVINDAISLQTQHSKSSVTDSFSCTLLQGDINYLTAIHPGDYVIVNMINDEKKALEIKNKALKGKAINHYNDGFKGIFKISDVRMKLSVNQNGIKTYFVNVTGVSFTEFNNNLYFNPAFGANEDKTFIYNNFKNFKDVILNKDKSNVQNLTKEIIKRTIGVGGKVIKSDNLKLNQIPIFRIPKIISPLLNRKNKDEDNDGELDDPFIYKMNNYYFGIWNIKNLNSKSQIPAATGFNNFFNKWEGEDPNWYKTGLELPGTRQISFEDFANVNVWSLIKDYSNPILNESYTCFRVSEDNHIYPSLVVRQKPFNNRSYKKNKEKIAHTQYLDLPRWKILPNLIYDIEIGRSEVTRINFVQVFTRSLSVNPTFNQVVQIANENFVEDKDDVTRHGRKPYIVNCNYDFPLDGREPQFAATRWANLVADWVMNGHLKLNGKIITAGIVDPICVGDNLEFDNVVYHIESISHVMILNSEGQKNFRTTLNLSMGISDDSTEDVQLYGEMDHTDSYKKRKQDYSQEGVLPGFSDTQDLPGDKNRSNGEEIKETEQKTFNNPKSTNRKK
jgi:hypothetical protein